MNTSGTIILPVKGFAAAKQRLAPMLSAEQRARFAAAMCQDVVAIAVTVAPVLVVTHAAEVAALLRTAGANILLEADASGHSAAVARAVREFQSLPDTLMLVIPGDAPLITADELRALFDAVRAPSDIVLVPNREGEGTNGIACHVRRAIPFHYGPGSLARHQAEATRAGLNCRTIEVAGLALDVDTPDDFALLRRHRRLPAHTARFLQDLVPGTTTNSSPGSPPAG